jgi:hypothetical protein
LPGEGHEGTPCIPCGGVIAFSINYQTATFRARRSADYDLDFDLDDAQVRERIAEGEAFLKAATSYPERKNAEDTASRD